MQNCRGRNAEYFEYFFSVKAIVRDGETHLDNATILLYAQNATGSRVFRGINADGVADSATNQGSCMAQGVPA